MIQPLVKWAGGKRQLLSELSSRLPPVWKTYYEPFVGGAALLTYLYNQQRISCGVISDANPELINLYRVVQTRPGDLADYLATGTFMNTSESYAACRARFNAIRLYSGFETERAGLFLYLNRHGFNGLWRVNRKGDFNVPFGRYSKVSLPDSQLLTGFSSMLKRVTIREQDFASDLREAGYGDLVYCDPPYFPVSRTACFTQYGPGGFSVADQTRLAGECMAAASRGAFVMVSNSDTAEIQRLYDRFHQSQILSRRSINSRGDRRTGARELIMTSYLHHPVPGACAL